MVVNHETADSHAGKFDSLEQKYLAAKNSYGRQIVGLLKQIQSHPTGRALLDEFGTSKPSFARIRPYNLDDANALTVADDLDQQQYIIARGARLRPIQRKRTCSKSSGKAEAQIVMSCFRPRKQSFFERNSRRLIMAMPPRWQPTRCCTTNSFTPHE